MQEQHAEHCLLLGRSQWQLATLVEHFEWSEDSELHASLVQRARATVKPPRSGLVAQGAIYYARSGMRRFAALAFVVALLVTASPAAAAGPTLRLALSDSQWSALDPQVGTFWSQAWSLLHATCTTLVTFPDRNGPPIVVPDGAAAYPRVSANGRRYTFEIRSDLRFSDGTRVTAASYAHAIGRLLDPRLQSEMAFEAEGIVAAHGRRRTLTIVLNRPAGDLLTRLALPMFCPVPTNFPVDPAGITLTVGSGPYHVASLTPHRSAVLVPNRFYRGPRPQRFARMILTYAGTPQSLAADVAAGRYDYSFDSVPSDLRPEMVKRFGVGRGRLYYEPLPVLFYLPFNLQSPLFRGNVPLRRAIEYAIDRAQVVRQLDPFSARRLGQLIPPGFAGHAGDVFPVGGANLEVARRLARGHLRSGRLVFYTFAAPQFSRVADIIVYNLEQIGLDVEVRRFGARVEMTRLLQPGEPWDLGTALWIADSPDASQFVTPILGPTGFSPLRTPRFEARLRAATALTGAARTRAFASLAQWALRDQAPVVPLYSTALLHIVSARLGCVSIGPTAINLAGLCLRE
jgi:peptide/nickel transport system substrate-binding protein